MKNGYEHGKSFQGLRLNRVNENPLIQSLKEVCLFFDEIGIEYMLVGGLAVSIWSEPRATVDIDFLVSIRLDNFDDIHNGS